ncbi:hypothetical protein [Arcobacter arenosus]|uniref:hypothetical protein n=1 Tax=Arcobacter arenosus TaxID=2576037 RepID=UPI00148533B1|nr:hypothetical protein [Arcobacter arenosus]
MTKKIDAKHIKSISYDKQTNQMSVFNEKGLLLYKQYTTEETFNKAVSKLLDAKSEA